MSMVKRQGLGRVRHLAVADLWIQQKAKEGAAIFEKLPGTENTSDIMTKPVEADVLDKHMKALGFEYRGGRHELTPTYNGLDDGTPTGKEEEDSAQAGDRGRKVGPQSPEMAVVNHNQEPQSFIAKTRPSVPANRQSRTTKPTTPTTLQKGLNSDQQLAALCGSSGHMGYDRCKRPGSKKHIFEALPGCVKATSAQP